MTRNVPLLFLASFLTTATIGVSGCHRHHHVEATAPSDTVAQGVVSVTGTSFQQQIILANPGHPSLRLLATASDSAALVRLGGVEVSVQGHREQNGLRVTHFTAVRVGGQPVVDGVLALDGTTVVVNTGTGRQALGNPPAQLRALIGARVWIQGPLATGPNSWGVIAPR